MHLLSGFVAMVVAFSAQAQNPYAEIEATGASFAQTVKYAGAKPGIADFVTAWIGEEPEDELNGTMYEIWQKHLNNKPFDKNQKVTVDAKNGYVCFEIGDSDDGGSKTIVEMCYWNCSDGKHKVIGHSVQQFYGGKAIQSEFGGIYFGIYNNDTHKFVYSNGSNLGVDDVKTGMENISYYGDGNGAYFFENSETGEHKKITEEEYNKAQEHHPVVTYTLPRTGKNIIATINNLESGERKVQFVWDGLKFKQE